MHTKSMNVSGRFKSTALFTSILPLRSNMVLSLYLVDTLRVVLCLFPSVKSMSLCLNYKPRTPFVLCPSFPAALFGDVLFGLRVRLVEGIGSDKRLVRIWLQLFACHRPPLEGAVWLRSAALKMLPTTSVNSPSQSNGALNSRDAARHTAGAKRYKYLRRLFRFRQMDFEFAIWQMLYLFTSPQRVYRNFHYRKQTKDQWARDDPAFLVLLSIWLCVSTLGFGFVLDMGFFQILKLLLWVILIDCIGVGLLIATLMWVISNKYLVKRQSKDYDVEWGYAFDVHLNAFYPLLVILHFIQLFFINHVILPEWFIGYFVGNTFWLLAIGYYIYITFLGYSALPFLKNTVVLLYPFALLCLLYVLSLALGWNFTGMLTTFYKYRVK